MPTGKLIDPGGDAQAKSGLGSILATDGKCFLFKNDTPNGTLMSGDPIVYYLEPAEVDLLKKGDTKYEIAVAYLNKDQFRKPYLTKKNAWKEGYVELWEEEWDKEQPENIDALGFNDAFKDEYGSLKNGLKKLRKFDDIEEKNPRAIK